MGCDFPISPQSHSSQCSVVGASRVEILFCTLGHDIVPILAAFLLTSAVSIGVIKYYLWRYRPLLQLSNLTGASFSSYYYYLFFILPICVL